MSTNVGAQKKFGTAAVYFTSVSSIVGALLFLRFGIATGALGLVGVVLIIVLGHMITIPTALALSELSTNTRVEGGGEYFIMSRSFGMKIGTTIGITLFLSQTISIAFYSIAFAESFYFLFDWVRERFGFDLPKQVISIPTLLILAAVIIKKGSSSGMMVMYVVNVIRFIALGLFFFGKPIASGEGVEQVSYISENLGFFNKESFFIVFAICFPAFTGMTSGVGLSGDLKDPRKSIPLGTMAGTLTGLTIFLLVVWKFAVSASAADLASDQLIMTKIAIFGGVVVPIGIAACASSSALSSMMVAPRTLQAIAKDGIFPFKRVNKFVARTTKQTKEPVNASIISFSIALVFIIMGDINSVAQIISMFFLITYGSLCLISFLNHFGSPPSYRPTFKSRWFLSLGGFLLTIWVMFQINAVYTIVSYIVIILIYIYLEHYNKDHKGLVNIFKGALFQLNRRLQVFLQKQQSGIEREEWRPSAVCVSSHSFERPKVLEFMKWISYKHGFGTYFHYIEGYYSKQTHTEAINIQKKLVALEREDGNTLYIDTMISPSYTSAIAQVIQSPSISGMENNLIIFEYERDLPGELTRQLENVALVKAGDYDVGILSLSDRSYKTSNGIHVWIRNTDEANTNFMILLGYIILLHPDWKKSHIKIFIISKSNDVVSLREELSERIIAGRLPITLANIEIVVVPENYTFHEVVAEHSGNAALTLIGFREEMIKRNAEEFFGQFKEIGDILFINVSHSKEIV